MARRFVRVDLSDNARTFRPVAVEPGLPMLDPSGASAKILFCWLGRLVAEPQWEGESVNFYVRDDHGGRLEDVICHPATRQDLEESLSGELELLRQRIDKIKPETASEQAIHKILTRTFRELTEDPYRSDLDDYFFRYRDVQNRWRLVWCWGYQRMDQEPAAAVICTDPDCNLLFVRRPGLSQKCPSCAAVLAALQTKRSSWKQTVLAGLLLFLLGTVLVYWYLHPPRPKPTPPGPVTLRLAVDDPLRVAGEPGKVALSASGSQGETDLAPGSASFRSSDPNVLKIDEKTGAFEAAGPGEVSVTATHPAADLPATLKLRVVEPAKALRGDRPLAVRILSDQGPSVRIPVGSQFDDFRVEAEYANGFTRPVTKKATLRLAQPPEQSPVAASQGRLTGIRPGQTVVQAEFEGVRSQKGLEVAVTADLDVDEIRLTPSPATILPGQTIALDAVGYKGGKAVGSITGLADLTWKSSNEQVVRAEGSAVIGIKPGQAAVTAQLGALVSRPAEVNVAGSIAAALAIDPQILRMQVGESRRIGTDLTISSGPADISRLCEVTPALPAIVRYNPQTQSLVGVSPGSSTVSFAWGDQLAEAIVEVLPGEAIQGEVLVEPASGVLAPGQALALRVLVVGSDGHRFDCTDSAVLASSSPDIVAIRGNYACALAPGTAKVTATLAGNDPSAGAQIVVNGEKINELIVEPPQMEMSVGEQARLRILGRTASGSRELFAQPDLKVTAGGSSPQAVRIVGTTQIDAVAPGQADLSVRWRDQLSRKVPVRVIVRGDRRRTVVEPGVVVPVEAGSPERLWIEPGKVALEVGQTTPRFTVLARGASGEPYEVAAVLESTDPAVLAPQQRAAGRFVAQGVGSTQVRAAYRGREAFADVTIGGKWFLTVHTKLNEGDNDFDVTIEVLAAGSEGPLEYRVYAAGQTPPATWQPAQHSGEALRAVLRSPRLPYGRPSSRYQLIIEARDPGSKSVQQYPLTFRLVPSIERTDALMTKPTTSTP